MEFDKQKFFRNLLEAPAEEPFPEPPEYSEYLQTQVFDKLSAGEEVDLKALDWSAFDLRHVTPKKYGERYERTRRGWLEEINWRLRKSPAADLHQKRFFEGGAMYGYDYEYDFLLSLRVMKCLHQQDPAALDSILKMDNWLEESIFVLAEYLIWEIFSDVVMYENDDNGFEIAEFSHPAIRRFCDLIGKRNSFCGGLTGSGQRKLSDAVQYFLRSKQSVCDVECLFYSRFAKIKVWFSPDCYDSLEFGNALVDLLLWLRKENERMERLLKETEYGKEAA